MEITGHKNLSLTKKALISHLTYCAYKAMRATDEETKAIWDPEISETKAMLKAVEFNISIQKINGE